MSWFQRKVKGITTPTEQKKDAPDGLWFKTPGGTIVHTRELKNNAYVSPEDGFHVRIGSKEYFEILFDQNQFTELDANMSSGDPLAFVDSKPYPRRIKETQGKTKLMDAARTAYGKMNGLDLVVTCMSPLSRNYRVGYAIGSGQSLEESVDELGEVAEGVNTLRYVREKARELGIYMPLVMGAYEILFNAADPKQVAKGLMTGAFASDVEFALPKHEI